MKWLGMWLNIDHVGAPNKLSMNWDQMQVTCYFVVVENVADNPMSENQQLSPPRPSLCGTFFTNARKVNLYAEGVFDAV